MSKKATTIKTTSKKTTKAKSVSPSTKTPKKDSEKLKVNKEINIQTDKSIKANVPKEIDIPEKQAYLFPAQETELGSFQLDPLHQKKAKESKDIDLKEAWYCPSKELHDAFRFYSFQKNMKKTNVITKAVVEMLEREGFLKKS